MKSALKSFLIATLIIVFLVIITGFYLKTQAIMTKFHPLDSPFFTQSEKSATAKFAIFKVVVPPIDPNDLFAEAQTSEAFDAVTELDSSAMIWVDVQFTKDHVVVVKREKEFQMPTSKNGEPVKGPPVVWTRYLDLENIRAIAPQILTLKELMARFPDRRWIVNMMDYSPDADLAITKAIEDAKTGDRVVITSEQDRSLADIRKIQPMWLYGSSLAQITQFLFMNTLYLDALATVRADIYITPLEIKHRPLVDADVVAAIHHRGLRIFVGPVDDPAKVEKLKTFSADGLISSKIDLLKSWTSLAAAKSL